MFHQTISSALLTVISQMIQRAMHNASVWIFRGSLQIANVLTAG